MVWIWYVWLIGNIKIINIMSSVNPTDDNDANNKFENTYINIHQHINIMDTFWIELSNAWSTLYKMIQKGSLSALEYINNLLKELPLNISITYGQINKQHFDLAYGYVVIYISPRRLKDNINIMEQLYNKRINLPNLLIAKYQPYHDQDDVPNEILDEIDGKEVKINIDMFHVHCLQGYNQLNDGSNTNKPVLNLVITCNREFLDHKEVKFYKNDNKNDNKNDTSSRKVYFYKGQALDQYLDIILGEYNLIHYISYIELIPKDEAIKEIAFLPLESLRESIELISKPYKKACGYCSIDSLQMQLRPCRCKRLEFCCDICMSSSLHKC